MYKLHYIPLYYKLNYGPFLDSLIKIWFARVNSNDHQHICLSWPQILVLKLTRPRDPNSRLYVISYGTTPVDYPNMCGFYNSV